jgi:hypothetical protein
LAGTYGNLTFSNFTKILPNPGTINIAGVFTTGAGGGHTVTGSTVVFNGTVLQIIPAGFTQFNNLTISNPPGVNLSSNITVDGTLNFITGTLNTGPNVVTVGPSGSSTRTAGHVIGTLRKQFSSTGTFNFHVGTSGVYSPINQTVTAMTAASGELTVLTNTGVPSPLPSGVDPLRTLQRFWTLTGNGIRSDLTFNYVDADVPGAPNDESLWGILRITGTAATGYPDALSYVTMSPGTNQFTITGLESYSHWTAGMILAPTAANANVTGRVLDTNGRGVYGARVEMVDQSGNTRYAMTNPFGYYRFLGVPGGQTYVILPTHKRYRFQGRALALSEDVVGFDFTAEP